MFQSEKRKEKKNIHKNWLERILILKLLSTGYDCIPCMSSNIEARFDIEFLDRDDQNDLENPQNITLAADRLSLSFYFKTDFAPRHNIDRDYMTVASVMGANLKTFSLEVFKEKDIDGNPTGGYELRLGSSNWVEVKPDLLDPATWYFESERTFGAAQGAIIDGEYYFATFERDIDVSGTMSIKFYIYHPDHGQFTITTDQTGFDFSGDYFLSLGGNFDDNEVHSLKNNFQGVFYHAVSYGYHIHDKLDLIKSFIQESISRTVIFKQLSTISKDLTTTVSTNAISSLRNGNFKSSLKDFNPIPGSNRFDFRGNYHGFDLGSYGLYYKAATNMFSYGIFIQIKVIDVIEEYQLSPGTSFTEDERTFPIIENKAHSGPIIFGFYHRLTSNFEHVGGVSGNSHTSEFFFKIFDSGIICKSDPITSINQDLGLEWVYVFLSRDIWSGTISAVFKTNLMMVECTYEFDASLNEVPYLALLLFGKRQGAFNPLQPNVFFYDYGFFTEVSGGKIFAQSDIKPDCTSDGDIVFGIFENYAKILKCTGSKIKVVDQCLDPPTSDNGCLHDGTCTLCENGYYLDGTGNCVACGSNCDACSNTECLICKQGYELSSGSCQACTITQVWNPATRVCSLATNLLANPTNPNKFFGLSSVAPFLNETEVSIQISLTVDASGTYEQESIVVKVEGQDTYVFNNISSIIHSFNDNNIILYFSLGFVTSFDDLEIFFNWDLHSPDEMITIDYVRASGILIDFTQDCLLPTSDGGCLLCNKYRLLYQKDNLCLDLPERKYPFVTKMGNLNVLLNCNPNDRYCWDFNQGAVECKNPLKILWIDGDCKYCRNNCKTCQEGAVTNTTFDLFNCLSCKEYSGMNYFSGNNTNECLPCQTNCKFCFGKFSYCEECNQGYGLGLASATANNRTCGACSSNCNNCLANSDFCDSCDGGYGLRFVSALEQDCQQCSSGCLQCSANYLDCQECGPGYGFIELSPPLKSCQSCVDHCSQCDYHDDCSLCEPGFRLEVISPQRTICESCPEGCTTCNADATCIGCLPDYQQIGTECYKECPLLNTFNSSRTECQECHPNCLGCGYQGLNKCLDCQSGFMKSITNCSNSLNGFCCYDCPSNCSDCSYDNKCVSCVNSTHIIDKHHQCTLSPKVAIEQLQLETTSIIDSFFAPSKGEVVIRFDRFFDMRSLSGKYIISTKGIGKVADCSSSGVSQECRISIESNNNLEIIQGSLTFSIREYDKVVDTRSNTEYMIRKQTTTVSNINYFDNEEVTKRVEGVGVVASQVSNTAMGFMFLSKISSLLQMVKLTQYVEFMLYFNIQYPANLHAFIQFFSTSILDYLPNPWKALKDPDCLPPNAFNENDAHCLMLQNTGMIFCTLFLFGVVKLVISFLAKISKKYAKNGKKTCLEKTSEFLSTSMFLLLVDGLFFEFSLFAALQIRMNTYKTFYAFTNLIFGYCTFGYLIAFMSFTFIYTKRMTDQTVKVLDGSSGLNYLMQKIPLHFLFNDLNMNNIIGRYFFFIAQLRNFLNGTVVVMFYNFPTSQIFWHISINTLYLSAVIYRPPFLSNYDNAREIITAGLMVVTMIGFVFLLPDFRSNSEMYNYYTVGFAMIGLFGTIFTTIVIFAVIDAVRGVYGYIKKKFCQKENKKKKKKNKRVKVKGRNVTGVLRVRTFNIMSKMEKSGE